MKDYDPKRRQILRILLCLPTGFMIGWDSERRTSCAHPRPPTPAESLKRLILLLGPWSSADRKKAEDFAERFLKAKQVARPYLSSSGNGLQTLATRFPSNKMAIQKIDLRNLPPKEQQLLMRLVRQLYSFTEVRFYIRNEPPWGECQDDTTRHTRAPVFDGDSW
jgi:hypothetical protein